MTFTRALALLAAVSPFTAAFPSDAPRASDAAPKPQAEAAPSTPASLPPPAKGAERFVKEGVVVDFSLEGPSPQRPVREGEFAVVKFRVADATSGLPMRSVTPGAWMDISGAGLDGVERECRDKVSTYLRGLVGIRPLIDLNSYYLLLMNQDATISVVDPIVGMTGKTSLYAKILIERPGADWVRGRNDKRLYVSMPRADKIAVIDGESFKLVASVEAGTAPTRVALQHDGRYLWIGNDAKTAAGSGVTVVDTETLKVVARLETGRGHHEIAFSTDDRMAFVTNREEGTVTVVDVARLAKLRDVKTGPLPISVATSPLSRSVYVADGKSGRITVLDPVSGDVAAKLDAKPGLGPMQFTQDGRWGFVVNPAEHVAHVIDAATNRIAHTIAVAGQPYQVSFTRQFAYLRLLDSERVAMVNLGSIGADQKPTVHSFPAGARAPKLVPDLSIATAITPAASDAAVFVASPADNSTYFYMEGMNAPMGSFGSYGHQVRAVAIVDRSLKEVEPGVYAAAVRIPEAGKYNVAFILDAPRIVHCFGAEAEPDPALRKALGSVQVEHLDGAMKIRTGERALRFRLLDPVTREPKRGLGDVRVVHFLAPGRLRTELPAREVGDGVYEARAVFPQAGSYYVHVSIASLKVKAGDLPYRTLFVEPPARPTAKAAEPGSAGE